MTLKKSHKITIIIFIILLLITTACVWNKKKIKLFISGCPETINCMPGIGSDSNRECNIPKGCENITHIVE